MKSFCFFIFCFCVSATLCAQEAKEFDFVQMIKRTQNQLPPSTPFANMASPSVQLQSGSMLRPGSLKKKAPSQLPLNPAISIKSSNLRSLQEHCKDTSYRRLLSVQNAWVYLHPVTQTKDGNFLLPLEIYDSTRHPEPFWKGYGLLVKMDENGTVLWVKQFEDLTPSTYNSLIIDRAFELVNGDIVCTGFLSTDGNTNVYKTTVYHLTAAGDLIWKTCFESKLGIFNSPVGTFTYWINSVTDGLNGDLILCGTSNSNLSSGHIETVVRLNNAGQLIWDANYGNHGNNGAYLFGAEGIKAFVKNGQIILVGLSNGTNNPPTPPAVTFLTLDYNNGNLLVKRFFRPSYADQLTEILKSFNFFTTNCSFLQNGHLLFYGKLFSDALNMTTIKDHFGVIEFDASFNVVEAYTISSTLKTNSYYNLLYFDSTGRGLVAVSEFLGAYECNGFYGAFENKQFQNQRKYHYVDVGLPNYNSFAYLKDGGYAFFQSYFDNSTTKGYVEFRKMHNSDTASQCLGRDTLLFGFSTLNIIEDASYWLLDPNDPNKLVVLSQNISESDTLTTASLNPCQQTNYCDTVKIHGTPVICGNASSIEFTAFKNVDCGGIVQWNLDRTATDSMHVLSDTSVRIWFKNINWQGKLYATLPAGACYLPAFDSAEISIVRVQKNIVLGADTLLCKGSSLQLHAGSSFTSYLWQDGSTDSVLTVNNPGIYWVHANDLCGNNFHDTIIVGPFLPLIDIGADRTKCNNDTLHLDAPPGFLNYSWSSNYNISSVTAQKVMVNPLVDTAYYIKAEKIPGCFAYDTVRIHVNTSPPINLGIDKSFCSGDSSVFDAGSSFNQYAWSNGSATQQITVKTIGSYSVIGTTAQGCKSYDTVRVVTVFANPAVSLDQNHSLCAGTSKVLDAGSFSSYLWNDGNTQQKITVNTTGTFAVQVWDNNGCKGSDTTSITTMLALPTNFLPADTALCSYDKLMISPRNSYNSYQWYNGASASSIEISRPGIYWLQVKDVHGCVGRDSVVVNLKDCMKGIYIPTAFSPNNDGKNDVFSPLLFGHVKKYQFIIYNRWGQVVFQSTQLNKTWDGSVAGILQDPNVFTWMCTYQFEGEEVKTQKGVVVLIR